MQSILLGLDTRINNYASIDLMQGYNYTLEAHITDNYKDMDLTGVKVQLQMQKPDKKFIIQTENIIIEGNKIKATLDKDFTREDGQAKLQVVLLKDNFTFGSWVVKAKIKPSAINDNDGQSENKVTITEGLINKINEAENTKIELDKSIVNGDVATIKGNVDKIKDVEIPKINEQLETNAKLIDTINSKKADKIYVDKIKDVEIPKINSQLEEKAKQVDVDKANGRIDNLIVNSGESLEKDSELLDMRVNSEGKVYNLAGDSIREIDKKTRDIYETEENSFLIADGQGNVIMKVDNEGIDVANSGIKDMYSNYSDEFYITDNGGNVIFKANKDGISGINIGSSTGGVSTFKNMKLLTIGDSLSAHDKWQKWLVEWLGVTFDVNENINGTGGHQPMAKGGTAIRPNANDSIYMRALDAKYYTDNINGTLIILYAGANDWVDDKGLGSINDIPYTDRVISSNANNLSFYSTYMGMVENLLVDIPKAKICLMTQMRAWENENQTGIDRETLRSQKAIAIREIGEKYGLKVIDLYKNACVNQLNGSSYYPAKGNIHPTDYGYKEGMAKTIYIEL